MTRPTDNLLAEAQRTAPTCPHFGTCGGCAVQTYDDASVAVWKRDFIVQALQRVGLTTDIAETVTLPPATRRRATLAARRIGSRVLLGFNERKSDRLVDVTHCAVLLPELMALVPSLRTLVGTLLGPRESADLALTHAETGIELILIRARKLALPELETLASFAEQQDLARLAYRASPKSPVEPIAERRSLRVTLGGVQVALPPAPFLQASLPGERALIELVEQYVGASKRVADLFAGIGTFALPLAAGGATVEAYDSTGDAIAALAATRRVTAHRRDLFREPLTARELTAFDAALFDPPRVGAAAQAAELARSDVPIMVGISCNPTSFARDARVLVEGGYRLERVVPVDQFRWSGHIELAARFAR